MEINSRVGELIKPQSPSPQQSIALNSIDQVSPRLYVSFLLFFKNLSIPSHHLKLSLSKTLSLFYPLAGRYRPLPDQDLEIHCCDQGVDFFEAFASSSLNEAFPTFREFNPNLDKLVSYNPFAVLDQEKAPLLSIQVTRFLCGGACLQLAIHHAALDGMATADFLQAWGKISSGQERFVRFPHLDRSLPRPEDDSPLEFTPGDGRNYVFAPSSTDRVIMSFSNDAIRSMTKTTATRFEILAAQLWIAITRSRKDLSLQQVTKLAFSVDGRDRFDPPLPDSFIGNACFVAIAATTVEALLKGSIDEAVEMVKAAKAKMTHRHMAAAAAWMEATKTVLYSLAPDSADFIVSSWQRMKKIGQVDFGCGRPAFVGSPGVLLPGMCGIFPEIDGEDRLVAVVSVAAHQTQAFKEYLL